MWMPKGAPAALLLQRCGTCEPAAAAITTAVRSVAPRSMSSSKCFRFSPDVSLSPVSSLLPDSIEPVSSGKGGEVMKVGPLHVRRVLLKVRPTCRNNGELCRGPAWPDVGERISPGLLSGSTSCQLLLLSPRRKNSTLERRRRGFGPVRVKGAPTLLLMLSLPTSLRGELAFAFAVVVATGRGCELSDGIGTSVDVTDTGISPAVFSSVA